MQNLDHFYPIQSTKALKSYLDVYLPLVLFTLDQYQIDISQLSVDHLGLQVLSLQEFDICHQTLLPIADLVHDQLIHGRRNRVYLFKKTLRSNSFEIPKVEIFEPKPGADLSKLRPGIEHIAFFAKNYDHFHKECQEKNILIAKSIDLNGSKFFKTQFLNGVEIEFRNDQLGEST